MAETIKGINVVIGADTTGLSKALSDVDKKASKIQSELRQVDRLLKLDPKNVELLTQKKKLLGDAIANTRERLERLRAVQEQVNEQFRRGEISEGQYRAFQREVIKTEQELQKLEKRLRDIEPAAKSFGERMKESGDKLKQVGERITSIGKNLSTKVTTPLAGLGAVVAKTGMDFEAAMSEVAAISGATGDDLAALEAKAKEMGATTKFSASEAAAALKYMAMAGWDTQKMLDGLPGVMSLAAASGEDLAIVSDILTDAMTAFGMEASQAAQFADILAAASSSANTNVGMMGETFKYVAPVFGSLGYTAEDAALAIGLMANAGIKASQAGTALRGAITRMVKPTGDAAKLMEQLGIKLTDAQGNMLPFRNVMDQLRTSFSKLTAEQQAQYASTIFGQEAMSGMLAIINASEEDYQKLAAAIDNSAGAAERMAKEMQDNLKGRLTELKSAVEGVALQLYEHMKPALESIVAAVKRVVDWFARLSPGTQQVIVVIAALAAAIGPLLLVLGMFAASLGSIISLVGTLGPAIAGIAGPVGIAVAAIAGLGVGVANLINHFKQSSIEVDLFGDKVSEATQEAVGGFLKLNNQATVALNQLNWSGQVVTQNIANNIISTFDQMGDQVLSAMQQDHQAQLAQMQNFFAQSSALTEQEKQEALAKLQQHQQQEQQTIQEGQQRIAEILNTAKEQKRAITDAERQEINQIQQQMVETGIQYLSQNELEAKSILERMKAQAGELTAQQAAEVVQNSIKQRDEAIKAAEEQYNDVVKNIIRQRDEIGSITADQADKLIAEAKRQRDEAVKQAEEMHNKVVEEAKKQANEHVNQVDWETGQVLSKWEVFKNDMRSKWETIKTNTKNKLIEISNNIRNKYEEMKNTASDKFEGMKNAISEKMTTAKAKIEEIWNKAQSFLENIDLFEIGKDIIQGLINGIKSLASSVSNAAKDIASRITGGLKNALKISSPSRVMMQLGEYTGEGFALGLERTIDAVRRETAEMAAAVTGGLGGLSTPGVSVAGGVGAAAVAGSTINMDGLFAGATIVVRNDDDIRQLAREIWDMAQQAQRGLGGARV